MKQENQSLKQVILFLIYTFSITWLSWSVIIIGNIYFDALWYGHPLTWIPYIIGGLGPAISSYIIFRQFNEQFDEKSFLKYVFGKKNNMKIWSIFGLYFIWRFFMIWYAFEIKKPIPFLSLIINLPLIIPLGGLEELGWRGILQPRLEKEFNYLASVLMVGIIWGVWHLPLWLIKGTVQSEFPFALYLLSGMILTFSFTTLFKYTNNLFLCVISHAWFNDCIGLALYVDNNGALQLNLNWKVTLVFIIELIVSLILAVVYNREHSIKVN